jgi:hypothetical protein
MRIREGYFISSMVTPKGDPGDEIYLNIYTSINLIPRGKMSLKKGKA